MCNRRCLLFIFHIQSFPDARITFWCIWYCTEHNNLENKTYCCLGFGNELFSAKYRRFIKFHKCFAFNVFTDHIAQATEKLCTIWWKYEQYLYIIWFSKIYDDHRTQQNTKITISLKSIHFIDCPFVVVC